MSERILGAMVLAGLCMWPVVPAVAEESAENRGGIPDPSIATSLPRNGDIGGHRARLDERGITYGINYIGEIWRNTSGGVSRGTVNDGRLEVVVEADLEKMVGWRGGLLHFNGYYIHNSAPQDEAGQYGLSSRNIQNMMAISNIEALPVSRMFEAWFEQ